MAALSVGDVLELAKLIHSAYEKCAGAGETLHEVGKNLQYLHRSVIFLGDVIKDPGRFGPKGQDMYGLGTLPDFDSTQKSHRYRQGCSIRARDQRRRLQCEEN